MEKSSPVLRRVLQVLFFFSLLPSATSCSVLSEHLELDDNKPTLSIPYVEGDRSGRLTDVLCESIEKGGFFGYSPSGGEYTLKVRLCDSKYENLGFRYDPKKEDRKKIIPNETRSKLLAEVTVINSLTNKVIIGPSYVLATCEWDHQNYSIDNDINRFSMGQLSDIDTAQNVLDIPLYRNMAKEISLFLATQKNKLKS
jgi:hypothetical protein